jgi:exosortase/archaeosortase family protein
MIKCLSKENKFIRFTLVFISVFLFCYYAAQFITGLAVPGGSYSSFVAKYFDIAGWLRSSLILSTQFLLSMFGTETERLDAYLLRAVNGRGIKIVYACLGFAVMSFWVAYITASFIAIKQKLFWLFGGLFFLWALNVVRISLVLLAGNKGWQFPFGWDHHTWFNIIAYLFILVMIFFVEKSIKNTVS